MLFGVSHRAYVFGLALALATTISGQDLAKKFSDTRGTQDQVTTVANSGPTLPAISTEMRADIMMARKMYREAIDFYLQSPQDSAVILNKIGIAHHQLTELGLAKKYYERASKLKPDY